MKDERLNLSLQDKCEQYWPDIDQGEAIFGKISVTIARECQFADYVRRNLVVKVISVSVVEKFVA